MAVIETISPLFGRFPSFSLGASFNQPDSLVKSIRARLIGMLPAGWYY